MERRTTACGRSWFEADLGFGVRCFWLAPEPEVGGAAWLVEGYPASAPAARNALSVPVGHDCMVRNTILVAFFWANETHAVGCLGWAVT